VETEHQSATSDLRVAEDHKPVRPGAVFALRCIPGAAFVLLCQGQQSSSQHSCCIVTILRSVLVRGNLVTTFRPCLVYAWRSDDTRTCNGFPVAEEKANC
jgi:hypothetical protein